MALRGAGVWSRAEYAAADGLCLLRRRGRVGVLPARGLLRLMAVKLAELARLGAPDPRSVAQMLALASDPRQRWDFRFGNDALPPSIVLMATPPLARVFAALLARDDTGLEGCADQIVRACFDRVRPGATRLDVGALRTDPIFALLWARAARDGGCPLAFLASHCALRCYQ